MTISAKMDHASNPRRARSNLPIWEKEALLASEPDKFFTTPHYDGYPTVLVNLAAVDVEELTELIVESWCLKTPKRVLAAYEDQLARPADG